MIKPDTLGMIYVDSEKKIIEFCDYIQPIVNGCGGFIKTVGDFAHFPGCLILQSNDISFLSIIELPKYYSIRISGKCNTLLSLKEDLLKINIIDKLAYLGNFNKYHEMLNNYNKYYDLTTNSNNIIVLSIDDMYAVNGFEEMSKSTDISHIMLTDYEGINHIIYVSKIITPLVKGDTCKFILYKNIINNIYTVEYRIYKKKFKLNMSVFFNIII